MIYIITRWSLDKIRSITISFSIDKWDVLFSLCACIVLFSSSIRSSFRLIIYASYSLISDIFGVIPVVYSTALTCSYSTCTTDLSNMISSTLRSVFKNLFNNTISIDASLLSLLTAITAFFIISLIVKFIRSNTDRKSSFWIAYAALTVGSIYLALSATMAVPLLSSKVSFDEADQSISTNSLIEQLKIINAPASITDDLIQQSPLPTDIMQPSPYLSTLKPFDEQFKSRLEIYRETSAQMSREYEVFHEGQIQSLKTSYDIEGSVRIGRREKAKHFQSIVTWFMQETSIRKNAILLCQSAYADGVNNYRKFINDYNFLTERSKVYEDISPSVDAGITINNLIFDFEQYLLSNDNCNRNYLTTDSIPTRGNYGSSLGLLGFAISWILVGESMEVALIVGLVGFGMLGALVSRFVRSDPEGFDISSFLEFSLIILTGFVAALIVYISAYAGIIILSDGDSGPNPYAVFVACLVGATYSSTIWGEARERIGSIAREKPETDNDTSDEPSEKDITDESS